MQNARHVARRIIASLTICLLLGGLATQTAAAQDSPRVTGPVYVAIDVPPHEPTPHPIYEGGGGGGGSYHPVLDGGGGGGGGGGSSIPVAYVIGGAILLGGVILAYRARARR
jgi:hypothetical protein